MRSIATTLSTLLCILFPTIGLGHSSKNCVLIVSEEDRLNCYDSWAQSSSDKLIKRPDETDNVELKPVHSIEKPELKNATRKKNTFFSRPVGTFLEYSEKILAVKKIQRKMHIELENGQIWRLQKSHLASFNVGDKVHIKQGMVGGFILHVEAGGSYRVKQMR